MLTESILACVAACREGGEVCHEGLEDVRQTLCALDDAAQRLPDSEETDLLRGGLVAWLDAVEALQSWLLQRDGALLDWAVGRAEEAAGAVEALTVRAA